MNDIYDECYRKRKKFESVGLPNEENLELPFLAYGFFKPRQLAYHLIKGYVFNKPKGVSINYRLYHINGMPVLKPHEYAKWGVDAYIIKFRYGKEKSAYNKIGLSKNKHIYKWDVISLGCEKVNVLVNAGKESFPIYSGEWNNYDWRNDPIYADTLEYLDKNIAQLKKEFNNNKFDTSNTSMRFIHIQSLYRTLWTAIDRFLTFRYGDTQKWNVRKWADEEFFKKALSLNHNALFQQKFYENEEKIYWGDGKWDKAVFSATDLTKYDLSPDKPTCSALYYYTLRNNVVHAGKMDDKEVHMVLNALLGLTEIFRYSLSKVSKKRY